MREGRSNNVYNIACGVEEQTLNLFICEDNKFRAVPDKGNNPE